MNHRQLSYFIEVYQRKSIKKAAEYLMISPQGLSKTIQLLEKELQLQLFIRKQNSIEPTPEAKRLLEHAIRIVDEYNVIENPRNLARRRVVIYTIDGIIDYFTMDFLNQFYKTNTNITLKIIETSHYNAVEQMKNGEGDFAILQTECNLREVKNQFLFPCRFCMVVNKKNPLSKKKSLSLKDLDGEMIAGRGFEYILYENMIKAANRLDSHPVTVLESNNEKLLLDMAENNLAMACVSEQVAKENPSKNTQICILEDDRTYDQIYLVYRTDRQLSMEAELFHSFFINWIQESMDKNERIVQ